MKKNIDCDKKIKLLEQQKAIKYKEYSRLNDESTELCYDLLAAYQTRRHKINLLEEYKQQKTNLLIKKLNRFVHPLFLFVLEIVLSLIFYKQYIFIMFLTALFTNTIFISHKFLKYYKKFKQKELELNSISLEQLEREIEDSNIKINEIEKRREYLNYLSRKTSVALTKIETLINTYKQKINEENYSLETTNNKSDDNYQKVKKIKYKK